MEGFYYVYVLLSEKDGKKYVGFTQNLEQRFEQHNKGLVFSTKNRRPLKMIYFEGCLCKDDATHREKYLKTHFGKMFIKQRLKSYLMGLKEVFQKGVRRFSSGAVRDERPKGNTSKQNEAISKRYFSDFHRLLCPTISTSSIHRLKGGSH